MAGTALSLQFHSTLRTEILTILPAPVPLLQLPCLRSEPWITSSKVAKPSAIYLQLSLRCDSHKRSQLFLFRFQCLLVFVLHQAHSNDRGPDLLLVPMGGSHLTLRFRNDRS